MNIAGSFRSVISIAVGYLGRGQYSMSFFQLSFIQRPSTYTSEATNQF
jgi:hypothetical protein